MANILGSILSSFRKKDDEDELKVQQPAPKAPTSIASGGGGIANAIKNTSSKVSNSWNNFWKPSPDGVRARDIVRELPGATVKTADGILDWTVRPIVTRPVAQAILSVTDQANVTPIAGENKGQKMTTMKTDDPAGRLLFGKEDLKSYQQQTRDAQNWLKDVGVDEKYAAPAGVFLGTVNAGLDLPGGSLAKKPVKEVAEKATKEGLERAGKEGVEQVVKNIDELAPMLKGVLPQVKGNIDDALKQIEDAGVKIADDVVTKLKSGKVVEGEGYVLQFQDKAGKFIANFDKKLQSIIPERKATEAVEQIGKEADEAIKQTTKETGEQATKQVDEVLEEGASLPGDKPPGSGDGADEAVEALTKEQEFGKEVAQRKGFADLDDEAKARVEQIASDPKFVERMERIKGSPLTEDEVRQAALEVQDLAEGVFSKEQTKEQIAKELNVANRLNELMEDGSDEALEEAAPLLERWLSQGTDLARRLQSRQYAGDPGSVTGDEFLKTVFQNVEGNKAQILKEYKAIDRSNPQEFREFFFKYVKPGFGEVIDEYRYINILSSPKTQLRNVNANLIDSAITEPGTKVMRGFVDAAQSAYSKLRGVDRPRENFSREAVAYYRGYFKSFNEAFNSAKEVLQGKRFVGNPDLQSFQIGKYSQGTIQEQLEGVRLPSRIAEPVSKTIAGGLEKGGVVNRALEAGDIFFTTLIKNGEEAAQAYRQSRGVNLTKEAIEAESKRVAEDVALRTTIGEGGQGIVNDKFIDGLAQEISKLRNSPNKLWAAAANAVFPFVRTTANYTKRFLDYTPGAGLVNLAGRADKPELIARQLWSSTLMMGTLWYAFRQGADDNMTWEAPSSPNERELFYASGRKPYSVKIGDQWVSYQQLGMIGAPFALTAALKHQLEQDKDVSESQIQSVARAYGSLLPYFGDMSFARSFGNLSDAMTGDGIALRNLINEPFRQAVPLAGLSGWAKSILDPVYRSSESKSDNVLLNQFAPTLKNIPGLSNMYEAYTDPLGQESRIDKPLLNAFSPIGISGDNPIFSFLFESDRLEKQANKLQRDFKEGKIDAGAVERGINQVLQNAVNFAGGDPSQLQEVRLPEGADPSFKVEQTEEKIELTPEQEQEFINAIPQLKEQMLAGILGGNMNIGGTTPTSSSGRVSARGGFKVGSPPSQKLSSATGINISSVLDTPRKSPTQVSGITLPSTTSLAQSLPQENITAEDLLRRARSRAA